MLSNSKKISKIDDSSKKFIMDCLGNNNTYGFDIDSIYFVDGQWYLFEYLKCENEYMNPHTSNPKYYPWNYKKFLSLYKIKNELNGKLFLINYSDRESDRDLVKVMEVIGIKEDLINDYIKSTTKPKHLEYLIIEEKNIKRKEFELWLRELNDKAGKTGIVLED